MVKDKAQATGITQAVLVSRIIESPQKFEAEIEVALDDAVIKQDKPKVIISGIRFNLFSSSGRKGIELACERSAIADELRFYPWHNIIEQVCIYTIRKVRDEVEPLVWLTSEYGNKPPEYLLAPLFVKYAPNVVFAEKGSAKSLFMNLVCLALTLGWHDNPIGFHIPTDTRHNVLYFDWEYDAEVTGWTKECLMRGMGIDGCDIPYQRCSRPLADNIDFYIRRIGEAKADVAILDSLALAVGGNLNDTEPALRFFAALRQLPVTPIIVGQTSKDQLTKRKTIYGNALYEYEPRSIWEASKKQEPGSNELVLTLQHRKPPPFAPYHEPLAYRFIFNGNTTTVEQAEPDIKGDNGTSDIDTVLAIIEASDVELSPKELREQTEPLIPINSIYTYCHRLKKRGLIEPGERSGTYKFIIRT